MLYATRADLWSCDHTIAVDGTPLCRWTWNGGTGRGGFTLGGRAFTVHDRRRDVAPRLVDDRGVGLAVLEPDGRDAHVLRSDGPSHPFRHRPAGLRLSRTCEMLRDDEVVGHLRRNGMTEAHLPELELPLSLFVLAMMLRRWDAESR